MLKKGFTIVELLVVIVVIAVIAAISVLAYGGVQDRATNSSVLNGASHAYKLVNGYIAANGAYPYTGGNSCLSDPCQWGVVIPTLTSPDATLKSNLETIGTLPRNMPATRASITGIAYSYSAPRTVDGLSAPALLVYGLNIPAQKCGQGKLVDGAGSTLVTVSTPYSISNPGSTVCVVSLPTP